MLRQRELILTDIENKMITLGIFAEFSKVFDKIKHRTLLLKHSAIGIRNTVLNFISSYLINRSHCAS